MPITLTLAAFQAGTSHPIQARVESHIWYVDLRLQEYHDLLDEDPDGNEMKWCLEDLLEAIEKWSRGLPTRQVRGETRYRAWRDRKGLISRLEREARQTLQQLRADLRALEVHIAANIGRRHSRAMRAAADRSSAGRSSAGGAPARPLSHVGGPLTAATVWPGLPANTPLRRGSIAAAAQLLALAGLKTTLRKQQAVPNAQDLADAIGQATGIGVPLLQTSVLFEQIAMGLDKLGYSVDHVRRTDLAGLVAALSRASRTQPVLLCVGDRTPSHDWNGPNGRAQGPEAQAVHAVVCTGRLGSGDGFAVEDFHLNARECLLFDDGDYFGRDGRDWLNAEPSLGYIRVRALGW